MMYPLARGPITVGERPHLSMRDHLAENHRVGNYRFVPIVTEELSLWCGIDILFLRPGQAGTIFSSGDVDNRIKTVLDALKVPKPQDIGSASPLQNEEPFFCLLEDDGLVAQFSVETDEMLEHVKGGIPSDKDARIIMTVTVRPMVVNWGNLGFAG
jgi:hypothetical protein